MVHLEKQKDSNQQRCGKVGKILLKENSKDCMRRIEEEKHKIISNLNKEVQNSLLQTSIIFQPAMKKLKQLISASN